MKTKGIFFAAILFLSFSLAQTARAEEKYFHAMKRDLGRGLKNVLTSPLEIPITIQEYHESSGYPFVRHLAGLSDGIFQSLERFGSGGWDLLVAAYIPGAQEGVPPSPETLF